MYEPRHPMTAAAFAPQAQIVLDQMEAYFTPEKVKPAAKPVRELSPIDQMYAYFDEA